MVCIVGVTDQTRTSSAAGKSIVQHAVCGLPALEAHIALLVLALCVLLCQIAQLVGGGALLVVEARHVRCPAQQICMRIKLIASQTK